MKGFSFFFYAMGRDTAKCGYCERSSCGCRGPVIKEMVDGGREGVDQNVVLPWCFAFEISSMAVSVDGIIQLRKSQQI